MQIRCLSRVLLNYSISKNLKIKHGVVLNLRLFISLRNTLIKMIKIVYIILVIVSNMVDQGRIILQNFGLCNLPIYIPRSLKIKIRYRHLYGTCRTNDSLGSRTQRSDSGMAQSHNSSVSSQALYH